MFYLCEATTLRFVDGIGERGVLYVVITDLLDYNLKCLQSVTYITFIRLQIDVMANNINVFS